jgi:hypothetical protein
MNAADERSLDSIRQKVFPFLRVDWRVEGETAPRFLILDECETLTEAAQLSLQTILNYDPNQPQYQYKTPDYDANKEVVFKVKPEIQNDIYNLFIYDNKSETKYAFYGVAYIPDYTTSVMMNKLFRNIKENQNLDALEESDDEDEFEDERLDKYVYLEKEIKMICKYNQKFKKWYPCRLAGKHEKVAMKRDLIQNNQQQNQYHRK